MLLTTQRWKPRMIQSFLSFHHLNEIIAENPCVLLFLFCFVLCFQLCEILISLVSSPHYISTVISQSGKTVCVENKRLLGKNKS